MYQIDSEKDNENLLLLNVMKMVCECGGLVLSILKKVPISIVIFDITRQTHASK